MNKKQIKFRNEYGKQIKNINNINNDLRGNILKKYKYDSNKVFKEIFDYH